MVAQAPAAPDAPIDLDATVARLRALTTPEKISLSGALAVLMGHRSHGWNLEAVHPGTDGKPFCAWLLEHIMVVLLQLPAELLEGLKPLTEPQARPEPDPRPHPPPLPLSPYCPWPGPDH